MINDRIRAGAQMLKLADAHITNKAYENALKSAAPQENLRAMFLAALDINSPGMAVYNFWGFLHTRIHENEFRMTPEVEMIADVLKDEDIMSPAQRAACADKVKKDILPGLVHNEVGLSILEAAFPIEYDPVTACEMWKSALAGTTELAAAQRIAKRADPSDLAAFSLARATKQRVPAELYAKALSDERLKEVIDELGAIASDTSREHGWKAHEVGPLSTVLMAEYVVRHGVADGVAKNFFEQFTDNHYRFDDKFKEFTPCLLRIAEAVGRLDDERLYRALVEGAINHVEPSDLARYLAAGLPVTRTVTAPAGSEPRYFVVDNATLDRVEVIANAMDSAQRDLYLEQAFPLRAADISQLWSQKLSVLDPNIVTVLHAAGFDVGRQRTEDGKRRWPHEMSPLFPAGSAPVFTAMHALGVYPRDMRLGDLSPMHYAAMHNDVKTIRALVALGYDVNEPAGENAKPSDDKVKQAGNTPLVMAVLRKHRAAMEVLIELGADVGVKAATGATLMQLAKDEDTKRLIRAARTGASVTGAMKGAEQAPEVSRQQPGVL